MKVIFFFKETEQFHYEPKERQDLIVHYCRLNTKNKTTGSRVQGQPWATLEDPVPKEPSKKDRNRFRKQSASHHSNKNNSATSWPKQKLQTWKLKD